MKKRIIILLGILLVLIIASLMLGRYPISFVDFFRVIFNLTDDNIVEGIIFNIRMPRILVAVIVGGGLALAGFIYQTIFKNPLASPDILGVSSGASIGAILAILYLDSNRILMIGMAFVFGILTVILALNLAKIMKGSKLYNLVISGIIIGAITNSLIMLLKYTADPEGELAIIEYWLMGSLSNVKWLDVLILAITIIPLIIIVIICEHKLKLLALSDEEASSLGINVKLVRILMIMISTIIVASAVAVLGVIAWIGLIVPHIARIFLKGTFKENLIYSIFIGAIILLVADDIARAMTEAEIPIGILTSFIGAIFLGIFMIKKN